MPDTELHPNETDLSGEWIERGGQVVADDTCGRIETLVAAVFEQIAIDASGWETLYRDPRDGRLWERTYPHSGYHGGGPPRLSVISPAVARAKYGRPVA